MSTTPEKCRNPAGPTSSWKIRRRFMFLTCAFCAWVIAYCLMKDKTGAVAESAVNAAFLVLGSVISSYVFGAAWEDVSMAKLKKEAP